MSKPYSTAGNCQGGLGNGNGPKIDFDKDSKRGPELF